MVNMFSKHFQASQTYSQGFPLEGESPGNEYASFAMKYWIHIFREFEKNWGERGRYSVKLCN